MKTVCFIPIKEKSSRVLGKNFRVIAGKKLYVHTLNKLSSQQIFDEVFVDTDSKEIKDYCMEHSLNIIERPDFLTGDTINGNDLLKYETGLGEIPDFIFQMHVTSPFIKLDTFRNVVNILMHSEKYDSIFTAVKRLGWYWFQGQPINYMPHILPRSQDGEQVYEESTALYGITKSSFEKYGCRIGKKPMPYFISEIEAIDFNQEIDFGYAEYLYEKKLLGEYL